MTGSRKKAPRSAATASTSFDVTIVRMVKERGNATIEVPNGVDPSDFLETMRENGDDFLDWNTLGIDDLAIDITPRKGAGS